MPLICSLNMKEGKDFGKEHEDRVGSKLEQVCYFIVCKTCTKSTNCQVSHTTVISTCAVFRIHLMKFLEALRLCKIFVDQDDPKTPTLFFMLS